MFDNDGTLWCEKPMPIQLDFILRRLAEMAKAEPALRERQPWKAAYERDYGWFGALMAEHYAGDDTNVQDAGGGILAAYDGDQRRGLRGAGGRVPAQRAASDPRPRLSRMRLRADGRAARLPGGQRLHELHRLGRRSRLHAADQPGGVRHPARAGDRQQQPRSPTRATTRGGTITHKAEADYLDDGPEKPMRIWSRTGRRPLLAAGNSNGDVPMLEFTHHDDKPYACGCSSCTTTPSASSTTPPAPSRRSSRPAATAGRSSASRTTGPPSFSFAGKMARSSRASKADGRGGGQRCQVSLCTQTRRPLSRDEGRDGSWRRVRFRASRRTGVAPPGPGS